MKLGIVGSRRRTSESDKQIIKDYIIMFRDSIECIISGGCNLGADRFAEELAIEFNIPMIIHYPKLDGTKTYFEKVNAYYSRNELIVKDCTLLLALPHSDRKGGTENTLKWAKKHNRNVVLK